MGMNKLQYYIQEKLKIGFQTKIHQYNYFPKTKKELKELIKKLIKERGNNANLNDIDTFAITDMSYLFECSKFYGDISEWDVSNVEDMKCMFSHSKFNGDISKWDVHNVEDMKCMFVLSKFNGNIDNWDVSNVKYMEKMFNNCPLQNNPPKWYHK